jgi:hypothetical protein
MGSSTPPDALAILLHRLVRNSSDHRPTNALYEHTLDPLILLLSRC